MDPVEFDVAWRNFGLWPLLFCTRRESRWLRWGLVRPKCCRETGGRPAVSAQACLERRDAPNRDDAGAEISIGFQDQWPWSAWAFHTPDLHQEWLIKDDRKCKILLNCLCRSKMLSMNTGDKIKWNGSGRLELR